MLDLIKRIFSGESSSPRDQANSRLRLVLTHDRLGSSAQLMETLKEEILEVIARHVDIEGNPEVRLITEGKHAALDINIPIKGR
ncbi:MAG: cell division topological specificity factor MinE [Syntrophomonadaceae bacterium]|nr:cell division topological specificity factor MinE [Syntrophomonadaceae bacterium]